NAMALAGDSGAVEHLAEFGVVFLMFVIGLEFNLPKLKSMRRLVFGLGLSQVTLTIGAAVVGNAILAWAFTRFGRAWGLGWQAAFALGGALAMSSTAVVVKLMAELLVLIPALCSPPEVLLGELAIASVKAAALLTLLLVGGQRVMRWWLTQVAR